MNPLREVWLKIHNGFHKRAHDSHADCGVTEHVYLPVYQHVDTQIGAVVREAFQLAMDEVVQ